MKNAMLTRVELNCMREYATVRSPDEPLSAILSPLKRSLVSFEGTQSTLTSFHGNFGNWETKYLKKMWHTTFKIPQLFLFELKLHSCYLVSLLRLLMYFGDF